MKTPINNIFFNAAALFIAAAIVQCGKSPASLAGGASSTEVSAIRGTVVDSLDNPISGSIVRLRSFNYVPSGDTADSSWTILDTITNTEGRYRFDSVSAGHYCIECVFNDSFGHSIDFSIDAGETLTFEHSMRPMAVIMGSDMPFHPLGPEPPKILTKGMEHSAPIDSMGHFTMRVPSGWTRLMLQGIDSNNVTMDTLVYLKPGEHIELEPLQQKPPKHCDSLGCELTIVREILDAGGLTALAAESVVVISQNHVSELHLRSRGMKVLSRAIGKLPWLRVLDVGNNSLDSLPSTWEHLHNLSTLVVDSNSLWMIPASIGMIGTLENFDLSHNRLQSLPEPITYLHPLTLLNLNDNMLCNIGETTAEWADKYDPGWRETQRCR